MGATTITNIDLTELQTFIRTIEGAEPIILEELFKGAVISMDAYKQAVMGYTPVNLGTLRDTYTYSLRATGTSVKGELTSPLVYAEAMERGRAPGKMPPIAPLAFWGIRKGYVKREEALSFAWGLAKKIAAGKSKHQLKGGDKMFEKGYKAADPAVRNFWDTVAQKIIDRLKT